MTLSSASDTATAAQWDAAIDAVHFSAPDTASGSRSVSVQISDGSENSVAVTETVNLTAVPLVTTDTGSAAFVAGDNTASTPVVVDSGLTVSDAGHTTLDSATVSISSNFHSGEDVLGFTNNGTTMGDISSSYDAGTGVMTLTAAGGATLAQWRSALESVTYTDTAVTPNNHQFHGQRRHREQPGGDAYGDGVRYRSDADPHDERWHHGLYRRQ
jgi:hypothetical protein